MDKGCGNESLLNLQRYPFAMFFDPTYIALIISSAVLPDPILLLSHTFSSRNMRLTGTEGNKDKPGVGRGLQMRNAKHIRLAHPRLKQKTPSPARWQPNSEPVFLHPQQICCLTPSDTFSVMSKQHAGCCGASLRYSLSFQDTGLLFSKSLPWHLNALQRP